MEEKKAGTRVGASIITGLKQAIAWAEGRNDDVRVTIPRAPEVDVRAVRRGMGLSQAEFATRFGLPPRRCGIGNRSGRGRMLRLGCCWR